MSSIVLADEASDPSLRQGRAMKWTGVGLVCASALLVSGGGGLSISTIGDSAFFGAIGTAGMATASIGLAAGIAGTTLLIVGGVKETRAKARLGIAPNGLVARC